MVETSTATTGRLVREFGAYGLVSAVGLIADMTVLALLVSRANVHYLAAATISFLSGSIVVYALSVKFVFRSRRIDRRALELSAFVALGAAGLLINAIVMYLAVAVGHLNFMLGKVLAAGCTFGANFLLRRYFLFSPALAAPARAG